MPRGRQLSETKKCRRCGEVKLRTDFSKHGVAPNGVHSYCKPCCAEIARNRWHSRPKQDTAIINRRSKIKRAYGITLDDYDNMLNTQGGKCAICGTPDPAGRHGTFHIDHCHSTQKIRGLLCHRCNIGIGVFEDNPPLMIKAATYLANGGVL